MIKISKGLIVASLMASCAQLSVDGKTDFNVVGREMAGMLQNSHFAQIEFDEALTKRILTDYLADLDPGKMYFTAKDVAEFERDFGPQSRSPLHELLLRERTMEPAEKIYGRYVEKVRERVSFAQKLAESARFSFDTNLSVMRTRRDAEWPADDFEAQEIWRRQIEEELLAEELRREAIREMAEEKGRENPLKDSKTPREMVKLRYERILQTVQGADEEDIAAYFLSAVARAHDPHTDYLSKRELERFQMSLQNQLIGIGALLQSEDDGTTKIIGIVVNGPADKQGELQLNDKIVAVDHLNDGNLVDTVYMKIDHVVELIRGEKGTEVRLKVEPADGAPGELREIIIRRDRVELKDEAATAELIKMNDGAGGERTFGWIALPSFYLDFDDGEPSVAKDVQRLLVRLKEEGIDGLVLDLRGNGGGALEEVRKITGFFVGRGPVVQVKKIWGNVDSKDANLREPLYDGPVVVVTDKTSASASEILAGALQDYNRAVVVGESSTYGKGTVQQPMDIGRFFKFFENASRAGSLKATVQKFYRVTGSSTQLEGVVPDVRLPSLTDALEIGERYEDHALKHDLIRPARGFNPAERSQLFVDQIKALSAQRVAASQDFSYIREDVDRMKQRIEANQISLNIESRRKELEESENRRKTRNKERFERFAEMEKEDETQYSFYRLSLDDLERKELEEIDRKREAEANMRRAKNEVADLYESPEWPSGLDPVKRESIQVLADLTRLTESARVAQLDVEPEATAQ